MTQSDNPNASIPVELTLEVGRVTIPLGRLLTLSDGITLNDEVLSYFPKVIAKSGDRGVAEGELVRIGDRVGFRITKLLG